MNACIKDVKVRWVFLETGEVLQAFTWHMVYASKIRFFFGENHPDKQACHVSSNHTNAFIPCGLSNLSF